MRPEDAGHAHPGPGDLLEDDGVRDRVDGDPSESLRHKHAEQTHRPHLVDDLFRIAARELPFARDRADALACEVAHQVAERSLLIR